MTATDLATSTSLGEALKSRRVAALHEGQRWKDFRTAASSAFTFVEACGLAYAGKLFTHSLPRQGTSQQVENPGLSRSEAAGLVPRLEPTPAALGQIGDDLQCDLVAGVLQAMSLPQPHARLILLAGHGSQSANNPHAAGLDCGACGGQTGEVNARVLASLLNDPVIRRGLESRGKALDDSTYFIAGLHNTTIDEVTLFDLDAVPATHAKDVAPLQELLTRAGRRARQERAAHLDMLVSTAGERVHAQIRQRANDWAQVRPEWGLADNAAFIVAPRSRTRHINLAGRAFLHDFRWQDDSDGAVLELIMTAPMVVTNWINLQYYASTVDNLRYGSGNKVLHNVVGGHLGVFEGNGGDLRIGLPWQSLHDGTSLRHTPLRLSVFIEAPQAAIDAVVAKHVAVRQLIEHKWLHLHRIADSGDVEVLGSGQWERISASSPSLLRAGADSDVDAVAAE